MSSADTGLGSLPLAPGDLDLLTGFLDTVPGRVVVIGLDHRYLYVNQDFLDSFGLTREAVIGQHPREVLGEDAYARQSPTALRAEATGRAEQWEGWSTYADGRRRYVQQIVAPLMRAGRPVALVSYGRDLTDLHEHAQAAAEHRAAFEASEALSGAIVASALDCVVVIDEAARVVEFNPAAEATFGYARAAVLGRPIGDLIVPEHLRHAHTEGFKRYLATGKGSVIGRRIEVEAMRSDGSRFPVELAIKEVRVPGRRLFTAYLRDLTPARRAAAELEASRDKLHQVEKLSAMGSLLAGVAHELNNPLAVVLAQATLLRSKAPDENVQRRAERIHAAAERSARIVKSFLAMARQKPPQREPVDINDLAQGALDLTAYGRRSAGIALDADFAAGLPRLEADRDLIGQVIANLLLNAQQVLLDRPEPRRIWLATAATPGGIALTVADNGPGVPPDLKGRIFEPYFTTKPVGVGTGIGLSICRSVVGAHGGRIEVLDRPGGGASFRVVLPVADAVAQAAPSARAHGPAGLNVLVVDDEADVGQSLAELLQSLGHRTTVLDLPEHALAAVARERFDLVFADLRMPRLGGLDLRRHLAAHDPGLARRTVIVTGDTVTAGLERPGSEAGLLILEKPFALGDVEAALARALEPGA